MAKVGVEVVGDSASAAAAFRASAAAATAFGDDVAAVAAKTTEATETMIGRLRALQAAYTELAASATEGSDEQVAAASLAAGAQERLAKVTRATAAAQDESTAASTRSSKSAMSSLASVGKGMSMYVTLPLLVAAGAATKMALSFDSSMELIHTQAGATQAEVDRMRSAVLQLVQSGNSFGQTATSMSQGLFMIESEGIRGGKALQVLKAAAAGAAVGQASLQDTANALTSAMRVYGSEAGGAAKVMATLNATVGQGKMHMTDLEAALATKLLPTAKSFGVTLPQLGAAIDIFTKAGVPASSAATNLTTSLIRMESPTKAGVAALAQLGINSTQLASEMQKGGLTDALTTLAGAYNQLVASGQKVQANQDIFAAFGGTKGGAAALTLVQQYADYMKTVGTVQQQSNPATFWSDVSAAMNEPDMKIKASLAELGADMIKIGQDIAPVVADVAHGLTEIANAFSGLPGPAKTAVGGIVVLLAAGGPLALGLAGITKFIEGVGKAFMLLPSAAGPAAATVEGELAGVQSSASLATGEVSALRAGLIGLGQLGVITVGVALEYEAIKNLAPGSDAFNPKASLGGGYTTAQLLQQIKAGNITLPDVYKQISEGLVSKAQGDAELAAFGVSDSGNADTRLQPHPSTRARARQAARKPQGAGGVKAPPAVTTLTPAQQLQLGLAGNPSSPTLLAQAVAQDRATLAWLAKRRQEGKLSNAQYVGQATPLLEQINADTTKSTTATDSAASKERAAAARARAAAARVRAAAARAAAAYLKGVETHAQLLKNDVAGYGASVASTGGAGGNLKGGLTAATSTLIDYYRREAKDSKLTALERAKFSGLALAARKTELAQETKDAAAYDKVVVANAKTLVEQGKAFATRTRNLVPEEHALLTLQRTYQQMANDPRLTAVQRSQYATRAAAAGQQYQSLRNTFALPQSIALAQAKAHATDMGLTDFADVAAARLAKQYDEKLLKSHALSLQGQIDVYNDIAQQNQTLGAEAMTGANMAISSSKLASMLGLTGGAKIRAQEIISTVLARGGVLPKGFAATLAAGAGKSTPTFTGDIHLHGVQDVNGLVTQLQRHARNSATQITGPHAGHGLVPTG